MIRSLARPVLPSTLTGTLALMGTLVLSGCTAPTPPPSATEVTSSAVQPESDTLPVLGIRAWQDRLASKSITSVALTQAFLDRIARFDQAGIRLNSVIELNPNALTEARVLDHERAQGHVRGPLHGIPVLIKDNIDVTPMVNSAGSLALAEHRPVRDAFLVKRLRDAGAIVLGKTNLSEWANFRSSRSSSGWSSRGGQTRNAYAPERNPCGSSSGTGTAIAANFAVVGIGTETDGSIICPSAVSGLVGLKPTVGLVSRQGIIPISASQDTAGPMTRSVEDAAVLLAAIAAIDHNDPASAEAPSATVDDFTRHLTPDFLKGRRIGVLRQAMGFHPGVDTLTERAITQLREAGAELIDIEVPHYNEWNDAEYEVLLYEFKDGLTRYLKESGAPITTLEALITWNRDHAKQVMPFFDQDIFELAAAKGPLTDQAYQDARTKARRLARDEGLLAVLAKHDLDALIAPSTGPAWLTDHTLGDHFTGAGYGMAAVAGTPSITVPSGLIDGLPVGVTFMAAPWQEPTLLGIAYAYEQGSQARVDPSW